MGLRPLVQCPGWELLLCNWPLSHSLTGMSPSIGVSVMTAEPALTMGVFSHHSTWVSFLCLEQKLCISSWQWATTSVLPLLRNLFTSVLL